MMLWWPVAEKLLHAAIFVPLSSTLNQIMQFKQIAFALQHFSVINVLKYESLHILHTELK